MSENLDEALSHEPRKAQRAPRKTQEAFKAESPAERRAKAIGLSLGVNSEVTELERGPSPIAQSRGEDIASKFIASAKQRNA